MKKIALWLLIVCSTPLFAQTASGDLDVYLNDIISNMPGDSGDDYQIPTNSEMTSWENMLTNLLDFNSFDLAQARSHADAVNYEIVFYTHDVNSPTINEYYVIREKSPAMNYWGTYVFMANDPGAHMVIQSPHASFDFNTGKQGIYCYTRVTNFGFFLNGIHRCNHSQASTCSGTTSVCGMSQAFRISDMAHVENSVYQLTTEFVYDNFSESVFVQLHGFTKLPDDPYVILSNGTDQVPSGTDYALMLQTELESADPTLTFKVAHVDDWTRLVGFTNTQGRYINQSANPCNTSATSSTGRFIHVEQEKTKLRDDETGWNKMMLALSGVFTPPVSVDEYTRLKFTSENPFKNSIEFSAEGVQKISLISLTGEELLSLRAESNQTDFSLDTSHLASGIYILKVSTDKGIAAKKLIRE